MTSKNNCAGDISDALCRITTKTSAPCGYTAREIRREQERRAKQAQKSTLYLQIQSKTLSGRGF